MKKQDDLPQPPPKDTKEPKSHWEWAEFWMHELDDRFPVISKKSGPKS